MKTLLTIREQDVAPDAPVADSSAFAKREAARGVLIDEDGSVLLLRVGKHDYHKLPGGGIDEGESIEDALARELMEEVGCKGTVTAEVGIVVEYRDQFKLIQTSYCYLVKKQGEQVEAKLEPGEIAEGLHEVRVPSVQAALELLESDKPNNYEGLFIQQRDAMLLREAMKILNNY